MNWNGKQLKKQQYFLKERETNNQNKIHKTLFCNSDWSLIEIGF